MRSTLRPRRWAILGTLGFAVFATACGAAAPPPAPPVAPPPPPPPVVLPSVPTPATPAGLLVALELQGAPTRALESSIVGGTVSEGALPGTSRRFFGALDADGSVQCAQSFTVASPDALVQAAGGATRSYADGVIGLSQPASCLLFPQASGVTRVACACKGRRASEAMLSFAASELWTPPAGADFAAELFVETLRPYAATMGNMARGYVVGEATKGVTAWLPDGGPATDIIANAFVDEVIALLNDVRTLTVSYKKGPGGSATAELAVATEGHSSWIIAQSLKTAVSDPKAWDAFWALPGASLASWLALGDVDWNGRVADALSDLGAMALKQKAGANQRQTERILHLFSAVAEARVSAVGPTLTEGCGSVVLPAASDGRARLAWSLVSLKVPAIDVRAGLDDVAAVWKGSTLRKDAEAAGVELSLVKQRLPPKAPAGSALWHVVDAKHPDSAAKIVIVPAGKDRTWLAWGCQADGVFALQAQAKAGADIGHLPNLRAEAPASGVTSFGIVRPGAIDGEPALYSSRVAADGTTIVTQLAMPPGWLEQAGAWLKTVLPKNVKVHLESGAPAPAAPAAPAAPKVVK